MREWIDFGPEVYAICENGLTLVQMCAVFKGGDANSNAGWTDFHLEGWSISNYTHQDLKANRQPPNGTYFDIGQSMGGLTRTVLDGYVAPEIPSSSDEEQIVQEDMQEDMEEEEDAEDMVEEDMEEDMVPADAPTWTEEADAAASGVDWWG